MARPSVAFNLTALDWLLNPTKQGYPSERVLARLICAEAHESDVWLKQDHRQAFITVALAQKGHPQPFVESSYRCYGLHPDQVYPAILERRKALLGPLYAKVEGATSSPKKPPQSVVASDTHKKKERA